MLSLLSNLFQFSPDRRIKKKGGRPMPKSPQEEKKKKKEGGNRKDFREWGYTFVTGNAERRNVTRVTINESRLRRGKGVQKISIGRVSLLGEERGEVGCGRVSLHHTGKKKERGDKGARACPGSCCLFFYPL